MRVTQISSAYIYVVSIYSIQRKIAIHEMQMGCQNLRDCTMVIMPLIWGDNQLAKHELCVHKINKYLYSNNFLHLKLKSIP